MTKQNARQAFQAIKGGAVLGKIPQVMRCEQEATDKINVYSDGSLINTKTNRFSLAGAGVWWPMRHKREYELSDAEFYLGKDIQEEEGLSLHAAITGFGGSSTRAEIAAGIICAAASGPVHIGSDSQSFITKARDIIHLIKCGKQNPKDLGKLKNTLTFGKSFTLSCCKKHMVRSKLQT